MQILSHLLCCIKSKVSYDQTLKVKARVARNENKDGTCLELLSYCSLCPFIEVLKLFLLAFSKAQSLSILIVKAAIL